MKPILTILVSFLLGISSIQAQWVTPPGSNSGSNSEVFRLNVINANAVWAMDFGRMAYRTIDGGNSWNIVDLNAKFPGKSIHGFTGSDPNTAWAAVQGFSSPAKCELYKSSDGGNTWVNQVGALPTNYMVYPNLIHFFDSNNGVIICTGPALILTTSDGGVTWTQSPIPNLPNTHIAYYNYCVSGNNIWVAVDGMRILRSTDKGLTWTVSNTGIPFSGIGKYVSNVSFTDANNGIVNAIDDFRKTTDGGLTWIPFTPNGIFHTRFISSIPGVLGGYVSANKATGSTISQEIGSSYSLDYGNTWQTLELTASHRSIAFTSLSEGWAGDYGFLRKYTGNILGKINGALATNSNFIISPNPGTGNFAIINPSSQLFTLEVYNMWGVKILQQKSKPFGNNRLDLTNHPKGMYIVKIFSRGQATNHKIVLQ